MNIHFIWGDLAANILGSSGSNYYLLTGGSQDVAATAAQTVWAYGLSAGDANSIDCRITYNPDFDWYTGTDAGGISANEYDLQSVITHEITHALGFGSSYNNTSDLFDSFSTSPPPTNYLTIWDTLLVDSSGNIPEAGTSGDPDDFNELDEPVYWTGAAANTLYGDPVTIYAPDPYNGGSSLSHIDQDGTDGLASTADDIDAIMNFNIANGTVQREYHEIEIAMLQDMDWSAEVVPEPATMSLLALGGIALLKRRRA